MSEKTPNRTLVVLCVLQFILIAINFGFYWHNQQQREVQRVEIKKIDGMQKDVGEQINVLQKLIADYKSTQEQKSK